MDRHVISPSILKALSERNPSRISSMFCLGLLEFCECEKCSSQPASNLSSVSDSKEDTEIAATLDNVPAKCLKLSLSKDKPRFAAPLPEDK